MSDEHASSPAVEHAAHDEHHPYVNYWYIFYALCGLTGLSVVADLARENSMLGGALGEHWLAIVVCFVVLAVACAKAMFVMLYFMHLKFEGKWKFVLLAPTMVLALAIPAALMPDIGSHYYDYEVPQLEPDEETAHAPVGHGTPGEHGAAQPEAEHGADHKK